jgi:hypothetical protein
VHIEDGDMNSDNGLEIASELRWCARPTHPDFVAKQLNLHSFSFIVSELAVSALMVLRALLYRTQQV